MEKYQALSLGPEMAIEMGTRDLNIFSDSSWLSINYLKNTTSRKKTLFYITRMSHN